MKVFIQNEAGSFIKHSHDEKTLTPKGVTRVSRAYPWPYGFVLGTTASDGLNVDCFVLTARLLTTGEIVECQPIGLMEQIEDGHEDHNVLAALVGEEAVVDDRAKQTLTEFVSHVFDHIAGKRMSVGRFLGRDAALGHISRHRDPDRPI
jgi:inorganic pyrophosphatase